MAARQAREDAPARTVKTSVLVDQATKASPSPIVASDQRTRAADLHTLAVHHFIAHRLAECLSTLNDLRSYLGDRLDKASSLLEHQCEACLKHPTDTFDGAYRAEEK